MLAFAYCDSFRNESTEKAHSSNVNMNLSRPVDSLKLFSPTFFLARIGADDIRSTALMDSSNNARLPDVRATLTFLPSIVRD